MSIISSDLKKELQLQIEKTFGKPINSVRSFEELSDCSKLSVQTLRRFFGKINTDKEISQSSLDLLCQYANFTSWNDFSASYSVSSTLTDEEKIQIESMEIFFRNGKKHNLNYDQNSMIVDTLNEYSLLVFKSPERFQYAHSLYGNNNWAADYFIGELPNYNYFGKNWYRDALLSQSKKSAKPHIKLACANLHLFGSFLRNDPKKDFNLISVEKKYKKLKKLEHYFPYHEMRYHSLLMIKAHLEEDQIELCRILNQYLEDVEKQELQTFQKLEMKIVIANTLLWLCEFQKAYELLQTCTTFFSEKKSTNIKISSHLMGINHVFVKATFNLAWLANGNYKTTEFAITKEEIHSSNMLLYRDFITPFVSLSTLLQTKNKKEKKSIHNEILQTIDKTEYKRFHHLLEKLAPEFC